MKHLSIALVFVFAVVLGVGEFKGQGISYTTFFQAINVETPAEAAPAPLFPRGETVLQGQPCDDQRGGVDYKSQILSREEVLHELQAVGFQGQMLEDFAAISLAESGRQLSCVADEHLTDAKWDISYGVWAIRALKAEQGKGTCRDIERLRKDDFKDQTICAYEISAQGTSFLPWSVTHANRGRPYLKYIGQ